jgi:hypothetical protein
MFRSGFAVMQVADAIDIPVFDGCPLAFEGVVCFLGDNVFHHVLPGAGC